MCLILLLMLMAYGTSLIAQNRIRAIPGAIYQCIAYPHCFVTSYRMEFIDFDEESNIPTNAPLANVMLQIGKLKLECTTNFEFL